MSSQQQRVGRIALGLLLIVTVAACSALGPDLNIGIDNTGGPREVTVTVDSSGAGTTDGEAVHVPVGQGAAWKVPLGPTWEVKIDGKHVIGSGDPTGFTLSSDGPWQDVSICVRVAGEGTVQLYDGCWSPNG